MNCIHVVDTANRAHLVNPAQVAQILPSGGVIGKQAVILIELSSGSEVHAIGWGSNPDEACEAAHHQIFGSTVPMSNFSQNTPRASDLIKI